MTLSQYLQYIMEILMGRVSEKTKPNKANLLAFSVQRSEDSVWIPAFAGMTKNKYPRLSAFICG